MYRGEGIFKKIWKIIYFCMQRVLSVLHSITWKIVGRPKEYEASAEVFKVFLKFKPRYYVQHYCSKEDFLGVHESFSHPDIVLQENVYFYCLTESEACFVDCGEKDIFNSSFVWIDLHETAVKVITMPLSSFHAIANSIPTPNIPVLIMSHVGRCGSTLMAKLFKDIPNTLSLSNPPVFNVISELSRNGKLPLNELKKLCRSSYALTCKHANARKSELMFVKMVSNDFFICDILFEVIPTIKLVFLYRQPLSHIRSYEKLQALNGWEVPTPVDSLIISIGIGQHRLTEGFPPISDEFIKSLTNFGRFSLKWILSVAGYIQLVKQGYPIKAIKYEDILENPKALISGLLNHANVPLSKLPDFKKVMSIDSQTGTDWTTRQVNGNFFDGKLTQFTDEIRTEVDMICEKFDVPRIWGSVDLPNKIYE